MKTHDVARALSTLAKTLRDSSNAELATVTIQSKDDGGPISSVSADAPAALSVLLALSAYSKDQWRTLIKELELDVTVKTTDSIRDILGRVLKYLGDNKDVQAKVLETAQKSQQGTSPELMKALSILLNK